MGKQAAAPVDEAPLRGRDAGAAMHHPVLEGYAERAGAPVALDGAARRRLALYRLHLHLLMVVEMPSRGMAPDSAPHRYELLDRALSDVSRRAGAG